VGFINLPPAIFDLIKDLDNRIRKLEFYGSTRQPYAVAAGNPQVAFSAVTGASVSITYPTNRFTVTPVVTFTPTRITSNVATTFSVRVIGNSTNGATLTVEHRDGSTITETIEFDWVAVQMTSTSATG
jgi:hypothetical protein